MAKAPASLTPHKRVLLVDDFKPWRSWVRSRLTAYSLQISEAADGSEAVQKAGELKPDLILLDIGLPDMSGIEVAHQIRQRGIASEIVFLTLVHGLEIQNAAIAAGAKAYVLKTNASRDLIPALKEALGGGRTHQLSDLASSNDSLE